MRLQKYMADCGVASRRKCEAMIAAGRVAIGGLTVTEMGIQVDAQDTVTLDGAPVLPPDRLYYILYHKPFGEVCTTCDPQGRPTVLDRFRHIPARLYPVGRLDFDSEGLLLLTNDGALTYRMLHPSHEVRKVYQVRVIGAMTQEALDRLAYGILLDGKRTAACGIRVIRRGVRETSLLMTIHEGRNRQIRRMTEAAGYRVSSLRRVQIGPLRLDGIKRGQWRELTEDEIKSLQSL